MPLFQIWNRNPLLLPSTRPRRTIRPPGFTLKQEIAALEKRLISSVAVVAMCLYVAFGQESTWREYEYAEDGFAVSLPFKPRLEVIPVDTEAGRMDVRSYDVDSDTWNLSIAVNEISRFGDVPVKGLLEAGMNGSVKEVKGELVSQRDISLDGTPGIEYEIRTTTHHSLARSYYVNGRLITVLSVSATGQPLFAGTERFFGSLRFIPPWSEYTYSEDGFAISSPSKPSLESKPVDTPTGQFQAHNYSIDLGGDTGVMVSVTDYGKNAKLSPDVLQAVKNSILESVKAKLVSEKPTVLDSNPGIEFEMANEGYRARMRYYIVGSKLVGLVSYAGQGKPLPHDTTRILDSLRLLSATSNSNPQ